MLGEDLADETEVAPGHDVAAAVGGGDPRRLLAAVLERVEREEGQARDLVPGAKTPNTPHSSRGPSRVSRLLDDEGIREERRGERSRAQVQDYQRRVARPPA